MAAVIGPLAASAAHGNIDERVPFGVIAALCLAVAALLFAGAAARRRFAPSALLAGDRSASPRSVGR